MPGAGMYDAARPRTTAASALAVPTKRLYRYYSTFA